MTQDELESLLRQIAPYATPGRLVFNEATDTVEETVPGATQYDEPTKRKVNKRVLQWHDPGTGMTLRVYANPDGSYTKISQGVDPKMQGQPATTPAQQAAAAGAEVREPVPGHPGITKVTTKKEQPDGSTLQDTYFVDASGARVPQPAEQPKPQAVGGQWGYWDTTTTPPRWVGLAGGPQTPPEQLNAPPTQRAIVLTDAQGNVVKTIKNPNYKKPSKIDTDPNTGRMIEITEDDDGTTVVKPVDTSTLIKPTDLPVLQTRYGQIAQGLGSLAQRLNQQLAAGEITEKQRNDAFTAAHQQAQVAVSEINTILDNSRSAWATQITQRGQTLQDTAGRRSYAQGIFTNALNEAGAIARSAGPGHGRQIAAGVGALLTMGQRYAEGMGGLRESPEVDMPLAVRQAQSVGLPGFAAAGYPAASASGSAPAVSASRAGDGASTPSPVAAASASAPSGISNTTDAGGVPRVFSPASSTATGPPTPASGPAAASRPWTDSATGPSILPWTGGETPPAATQPYTGQAANPTLMSIGSRLAPGGFDPLALVGGMLAGKEDDPEWAEAVRAAVGRAGGAFRGIG